MAPPANRKKTFGRPELHRRNTMDNHSRQDHLHRQPNSRDGLPPISHSHRSRGDFPLNSHSHHRGGGFRPNSHSHHRGGGFRPNSQSHSRRGGLPLNSHSHRYFKRRNQTNNMREGQRIYGEEEYRPSAPHNTTSYLARASNNGGVAFDSPRFDAAMFSTSNPNPNPSPNNYSPAAPVDYIPASPIYIPSSPGFTTVSPNINLNSLEEEHGKLKFRVETLENLVEVVQRRLVVVEHFHTDCASGNHNEAGKASSSEKSIGDSCN